MGFFFVVFCEGGLRRLGSGFGFCWCIRCAVLGRLFKFKKFK